MVAVQNTFDDSDIKPRDKETVIVSLCSLGVGCRYHGKTEVMGYSIYKQKKITNLRSLYQVLPLCGEILGGLPTPRPPCNVIETADGTLVVGRIDQVDYTAAYMKGAAEVLRLGQIFNVKKAFLLKSSPMCGKGYGILSRMLEENGIKVYEL
jgi:uncharacterized protein YbbK (DUF523 family)